MIYRVRGKAVLSHSCECDYCLGHDKWREVDVDVEAATEKAASDMALDGVLELEEEAETAEWVKAPAVEVVGEVPMEVLMERMGAPRLL